MGGLLAWLALVVVAAGSAGALSVYDQPAGLRLDDLDLLASPVDVPGGSIDRQIQWAVDFVNGAPVSRADLSERFAPSFLKVIPVDELLSGRDAFAHDAPYRVWAVVRKRADLATFALLGASGASYRLELAVEPPTGRIDGLALFRSDVGRQPMGRTALTLTIVAALLLAIVGNLLVRRPRGDRAVGGWFLAAAVACGAQLASSWGGRGRCRSASRPDRWRWRWRRRHSCATSRRSSSDVCSPPGS